MCPNDWRFVYSYSLAKTDPYVDVVKTLQSVEELRLDVREKFEGLQPFLYKDEDFVIIYDSEADTQLHLLFIPVEHIENLDVLNHLELLRNMFLAGELIVKRSSSIKEAYLSISSKKELYQGDYFRHFHLHLQSEDGIDKQELLSILTPGFYK
jgi:diadenosine tetraphosphate (Ap4A) HIT family hydrolase